MTNYLSKDVYTYLQGLSTEIQATLNMGHNVSLEALCMMTMAFIWVSLLYKSQSLKPNNFTY